MQRSLGYCCQEVKSAEIRRCAERTAPELADLEYPFHIRKPMRHTMAKNKSPGDNQRKGAVKTRSQIKNPITGTWTKRDDSTGKFMDVKADPKPFRGVRKEKSK